MSEAKVIGPIDAHEIRLERLEGAFDRLCQTLKTFGPDRRHEADLELIRQYAAGMLDR